MSEELEDVNNPNDMFKNQPLISENDNKNFYNKIKMSKLKKHMVLFLSIIIILLAITSIVAIIKLGKATNSSSNNISQIGQDKPDNTRYLLIHCAMKMECELLINELTNSTAFQINSYEIFTGKLFSKNVMIAISGVGPSFTSSCLSVLALKYNIAYILNIGVVGGYGFDIHMGDIIIPEEVINLSSYQTNRTDEGTGIFVENYKLLLFTNDGGIDDMVVYKTDDNILNIIKEVSFEKGSVHFGRFGTSEGWNKEYDKIMYHYNHYNALGEDMEIFSVYLIGKTFGIKTFSIKGVSNNEVIREYYQYTVIENIAYFTKKVIPLLNY